VCPHDPINGYNWIDFYPNMRTGDLLPAILDGEDNYLKVLINMCLRINASDADYLEFMGRTAHKLKYKTENVLSALDRHIFKDEEPYKIDKVQADGTFCRNYV